MRSFCTTSVETIRQFRVVIQPRVMRSNKMGKQPSSAATFDPVLLFQKRQRMESPGCGMGFIRRNNTPAFNVSGFVLSHIRLKTRPEFAEVVP